MIFKFSQSFKNIYGGKKRAPVPVECIRNPDNKQY